jgi:hypothetical protein
MSKSITFWKHRCLKFQFIFVWFDLWVGFFFDRKKKCIYILPLPMLGIRFMFSGNYCEDCKEPIASDDMVNHYSCRNCHRKIR